MSKSTHTINTYGILIQSDSGTYEYILEKLKEKHPDYFNDGQNEFEHLYYINDIEPNLNHEHNVMTLEIENIKGFYKSRTGVNTSLLILNGDHEKPTLVTSPFKTNEECIQYYKNQFKDILPNNFNYEENIGKIYVKAWN